MWLRGAFAPTNVMRVIDPEAIERHGAERFRSEFHYATFEYWRSAKVLRYLTNAGITHLGRVLDDGCGGGGMSVSFAEEAQTVVAIDLADRFRDAGTRLAAEQGGPKPRFSRADGTVLPFRDASFDLVISHAVIEHVKNPGAYLREARRVLRPGRATVSRNGALSVADRGPPSAAAVPDSAASAPRASAGVSAELVACPPRARHASCVDRWIVLSCAGEAG